MKARRKREEHDNHDRWLISYADFVTLLFAFFVVMYAISSVNDEKYKTFSNSLNVAFSQHPGSQPANINQPSLKALVDTRDARLAAQQRKMREQMKTVDEGLKNALGPQIEQGLIGIHQTARGVEVDIRASALFGEGDDKLQGNAKETLQKLAQVLSQDNRSVEVEGHTDNVPIKNALFPSNWELSSGRAGSVVRTLATYGVPENRMTAVGMAANQPIVPNDTPEHRAQNRRVSITILSPQFDRRDKNTPDSAVPETKSAD